MRQVFSLMEISIMCRRGDQALRRRGSRLSGKTTDLAMQQNRTNAEWFSFFGGGCLIGDGG